MNIDMQSLNRGDAGWRPRSRAITILLTLLGVISAMLLTLFATGAQAAAPKLTQPQPSSPNAYQWHVVPPVTSIDLFDVYMLSNTDGWAVGGSVAEGTNVTLHYDGTSWTPVQTGMEGVLVDVFMLGSNNVYVLSRIGTQGGRIYHYTGTTWNPEFNTDVTPNEMSGVAANDLWVAGLGRIYHWNGTAWGTYYVHPTGRNLFSIKMLSTTEGWVTGAGSTQGGNGTILHYLNGTWSEYTPSPAPQTLYNCYFRTPTDGWAVGTAGGSYIIHYDGSQWTLAYSQPYYLDHIWITSTTDGWAIGQNNLAHYTGTGFNLITSPSTSWMLAIYMLSSTDGWIVGESGLMLHYYDDVTPSPTASPTAVLPTSTITPLPSNTPIIAPSSTPISGTATATACSISFTDVPTDNTFYPSVRCLACRGIISGYSDGTFKPGNQVTRGQLAKIVSNAANFIDDPSTQIFEDVPQDNTFYKWINRLTTRGYMTGYNCGGPGEPCGEGNKPYFRPAANATRGQTSKIVANAAQMQQPIPANQQTFEDVSPTYTFWVYIERLASQGIMGGYNCGGPGEPCGTTNRAYFRPGNNVTRGQSAKIVAGAFYPGCQTPTRR